VKQFSTTAVLLGAAVAGFCWWTYSGPYRWLAEWQLATFGHYYDFYTFLFLSIAISAGLDQIGRALLRQTTGREQATKPAWMQELEAQPAYFHRFLWGGVGLLAVGAWMAWTSNSAERDGLCRLPLESLEAGQERTSDWVQVAGKLLWDDCCGWGDEYSPEYYVPVVSSSWRRGDPVTVYALYSRSEAEQAEDFATVQGMVPLTGLPGPVQTAFEEEGPIPAEGAFVVDLNRSPSSHRAFAIPLMLIGLLMTVGSLFLYKPQPEQTDPNSAITLNDPAEPQANAALALSEPIHPQAHDAERTARDWNEPPATESGCDAEVQEWLKSHNMQART
jgi:hypothetical protein